MPAGLAIAEYEGLSERLGMTLGNLLQEKGIGPRDIFDPLSFGAPP